MASESWAKVSVGLATFSFINLALFLILNSPLNEIFGEIQYLGNQTGVGDTISPYLSMWATVFGMMFVLSFAGLIVWFILGSHREEYEQF